MFISGGELFKNLFNSFSKKKSLSLWRGSQFVDKRGSEWFHSEPLFSRIDRFNARILALMKIYKQAHIRITSNSEEILKMFQ